MLTARDRWRRALAGCALAATVACARIEPPPGGPPDAVPPQLVSVTPDSAAVLPGFDGEVAFEFNEVVSEGSSPNLGTGMGDLERLVLLSPTDRVPEVRWRRDRITVRPREGWRAGTMYRVELLPGVMDLRNNRATDLRRTVSFTTGDAMPADSLQVRLYDWTSARPAPRGLVEAILLPDSLRYRFATDSAGRLRAAPVPSGTWLLYGVLDANGNGRREDREAFDSMTVAAGAAPVELWAFTHDTLPPRLREASARDSVTVSVVLSQPVRPAFPLDSVAVSVWRVEDSVPVPVLRLLRESALDSLRRAAADSARRAAADSAAADSVPAVEAPDQKRPGIVETERPSRPPLTDRLVVQLGVPLDSAQQYGIALRGVRNVTGIVGNLDGRFLGPGGSGPGRPAPAAQPPVLAPPANEPK